MQPKIDLTILRPFTDAEISAYLLFLRENGAIDVAAAIDLALHQSRTETVMVAPPAQAG